MLPEKIYSFRETPCQQFVSMCLCCWLVLRRHRDRSWPLANHLSSMENLFSYKQHFQTGRMNLPSFLKRGGFWVLSWGIAGAAAGSQRPSFNLGLSTLSSCPGQGTLGPTWKPAGPFSVKTHPRVFLACVEPCQPPPSVSQGTALGRAESREQGVSGTLGRSVLSNSNP